MKFRGAALLLVLSIGQVTSFVPAAVQQQQQLQVQQQQQRTFSLLATGDDGSDDVSVPYDAAARLAYDAWLKEFNKGEFNPTRYEQFKSNYEALTAANMAAKKKARDDGTGTVDLLTLNEYGDFSAAEYEAMQSGGTPPTTAEPSSPGTDIMGKAMEAVESQVEASNALEEAAEALAEEEEVRFFFVALYS